MLKRVTRFYFPLITLAVGTGMWLLFFLASLGILQYYTIPDTQPPVVEFWPGRVSIIILGGLIFASHHALGSQLTLRLHAWKARLEAELADYSNGD